MIIRFERNQKIKYGWVVEDRVRVIEGDIFKDDDVTVMTGLEVPLSDIHLLPPCLPTKIICIGLNYRDHVQEMGLELPERPLMFLKPSTSVIGPGGQIVYPSLSQNVHFEVELGVVIKKTAKNIAAAEAEDYIMGYTCALDMTARDIQMSDGQWTRGKSFDTFCPIGPGIVPKLQWNQLGIELSVNGEMRQKSNTNQLIFGVPQLMEEISKVMTLLPGDIILTGTPSGVGAVNIGDQLEVRIEDFPLPLRCEVVKE